MVVVWVILYFYCRNSSNSTWLVLVHAADSWPKRRYESVYIFRQKSHGQAAKEQGRVTYQEDVIHWWLLICDNAIMF